MRRVLRFRPIDLRPFECRAIRRIGNRLRHLRIREGLEALELAAATVTHRFREVGLVLEVDEELERRRGSPFLAHEHQGNLRREQKECLRQGEALRRNEVRKALAEGAVADLVVVLQECDEGRSGAGVPRVRRV